jgi:hypothetical protein
METPAGIPATLDRLAATAGSAATTARGVLGQHGRGEAYHARRSPDGVVFPEATLRVHSSPDLRA